MKFTLPAALVLISGIFIGCDSQPGAPSPTATPTTPPIAQLPAAPPVAQLPAAVLPTVSASPGTSTTPINPAATEPKKAAEVEWITQDDGTRMVLADKKLELFLPGKLGKPNIRYNAGPPGQKHTALVMMGSGSGTYSYGVDTDEIQWIQDPQQAVKFSLERQEHLATSQLGKIVKSAPVELSGWAAHEFFFHEPDRNKFAYEKKIEYVLEKQTRVLIACDATRSIVLMATGPVEGFDKMTAKFFVIAPHSAGGPQ